MRVALDATPMLDPTSGVPRYCRELVRALAARASTDETSLHLVVFSARGSAPAAPGTSRARRRLPARLLRQGWERVDWPPVELLAGPRDVFHGTNFVSPPSRAAAVVTVHDLAFVTRPETVRPATLAYDGLLRRAVGRGPLVVVCPSEAVSVQVRERYGLPAEHVVTTPLAASADWYTARPPDAAVREALALPERYLVFVGTSEPRKNLPMLLRAQAAALSADPWHPPLVVLGSAGWGEQALHGDGVQVLGRVSDEHLRAVVAGSAGLVLPSLDEGFGLPVLEAAAAGRPVAASDLPVIREVAAPGSVLADPLDTDAWVDALSRLASSPDGPVEREARRRHAAAWSWDLCAARTVQAYRLAVRLRG